MSCKFKCGGCDRTFESKKLQASIDCCTYADADGYMYRNCDVDHYDLDIMGTRSTQLQILQPQKVPILAKEQYYCNVCVERFIDAGYVKQFHEAHFFCSKCKQPFPFGREASCYPVWLCIGCNNT